jgi:hypothetical protein
MTGSRNSWSVKWSFSIFIWVLLNAGNSAVAQITSNELTPEEQAQFARQFAPVLVFRSDELYFPCSPLFEFESAGSESHSLLRSPELRTANYLNRTLQEKADLATVYYRAFRIRQSKEDDIVVEYWFYYVQDTYRARGNILPLWFDGSHPNDLEHVKMLLRPSPKDASIFVLSEVYASAHEGRIPANRYRYSSSSDQGRIHILVERGSHANAADMNEDGQFTPHLDGDSGYKMIWGIRDKGISWTGYSSNYMTPRLANSIVFSPLGSTDSKLTALTYRLAPTERLNSDVTRLGLSEKERKEVFQTHVSWFTRLMGRSNGNANSLLTPPKAKTTSYKGNFAATERGLLVGMTHLMPGVGMFVGGRYGFQNHYRFLPDLLFEANGIVGSSGKALLTTDAMLSYPIDATMKIMFGKSVVTDSLRYREYQKDWILASEVTVGRVRFYTASRSWGKLTQSAVDFRVSLFF